MIMNCKAAVNSQVTQSVDQLGTAVLNQQPNTGISCNCQKNLDLDGDIRTFQIFAKFPYTFSLVDRSAQSALSTAINFAVISFLFGLYTLYC